MTVLSDATIATFCRPGMTKPLIDPFNRDQLQPASYDLTLGGILLNDELKNLIYLRPKEFVLASTKESVIMPPHVVGRMEGKSSLARKGLIVHTAGFVDPGFIGQLTLEITNLSDKLILLEDGMRIAQIAFQFLDAPANRPYGTKGLGSHYQHQTGPQPSAI